MRSKLFLIALCVLCAPIMCAQTTSCPSTKTLDELTSALYSSVSGPADKDRTCMRELMLPDVRLIPVGKAKDGNFGPHILTLDDWITRVKAHGHDAFYEHQVKVTSEVYGHIAHLWSTYELSVPADGKPPVRGINSIQAVFNGTDWKVVEIVWQAETPEEPLPQKYLP